MQRYAFCMLPRLPRSIWFYIFGPKWRFEAFSPRRLFGLMLLVPFAVAGYMALFGPSVVLGPRPDPADAGVVSTVRLWDGASDAVEITPTVFGPGEQFNMKLTFETGVDGYFDVSRVIYGTKSVLWPGTAYPHPFRNPPPKIYPRARNNSLRSGTLTLEGLEVPTYRPFDAAVITLHVEIIGTRPVVYAEQIRPQLQNFTEEYDVTMKLGHGVIAPTGWTNFHAYNRQTWALVALAGLAVVYGIIYIRPRRKRLYLPESIRHETDDT